jgi:rhodanese-related sulfurtransferase
MRPLARIVTQSATILALSAVISLMAAPLRTNSPAPAVAAQSTVKLDAAAGEIGIKDAALLFISGRAVFLDARTQYEFELGHVRGAISLPPREFASQFQDLKPRLAGKEAVIAYCDGEQCPLGDALANHLRGAGVKNVFVLKNGWSLWQAERLPVDKGSLSAAAKAGRGEQCRDCGNK